MLRFQPCSVYRNPSLKMSFSVTKRIRTGPWPSQQLSKRNSMTYSRPQGEFPSRRRSAKAIYMCVRYTKALDSIKALRKDRVADLKAEKERLESLSREKQHADKLRKRISDLASTIATKEIDYEQTKRSMMTSSSQMLNFMIILQNSARCISRLKIFSKGRNITKRSSRKPERTHKRWMVSQTSFWTLS